MRGTESSFVSNGIGYFHTEEAMTATHEIFVELPRGGRMWVAGVMICDQNG